MSPLSVVMFSLGPMDNNTYLLADEDSREAVIIDPSFESEIVLAEANQRGWTLKAIWLTHAHFDHILGVKAVAESTTPALPVGLHPSDLPLYEDGGGARMFGMPIEEEPQPSISFQQGQILQLGQHSIEVRHTPGHTPGHVIFYAPDASAALVGDLIFYRSVGRTDLPGGNLNTLIRSIHNQIFTLPPETQLLSGHGPVTTVAEEKMGNPFL